MAVTFKQRRGTLAGFNQLVTFNALNEGVLYVITDANRLYQATGPNTYVEVGRGGEWIAAPAAGDLALSSEYYTQRWYKTGAAATPSMSYQRMTDAAIASSAVVRDANGRAKFAAPSAATDAANKTYVDTADTALDAAKVDKPVAADLSVSLANYAMTWSKVGASGTPSSYWRRVEQDAVGSTLALRDSGGRLPVAYPIESGHAANMAYVDDRDNSVLASIGEVATLAAAAIPPKNYIVNGDFHHLRNQTFPSATNFGFGFHRWFSQASTRSRTISRQTLGTTDAGGHPRSCYRCTFGASNTSAGKHIRVGQRIPGSNLFKGKTVTVAFWARSSVANRRLAVSLYRQSGSNDTAASAHVEGSYIIITSANVWQHFTVTLTVPNTVVGDVNPIRDDVNTTNFAFTELLFWFDAGTDWNSVTGNMGSQTTTGTTDITGVFLGVGDLIGLPLADRQRLFQTQSYDDLRGTYEKFYRRFLLNVRQWHGVSVADNHALSWPIPRMASTPAVTVLSTGYVQNLSSWKVSASTDHTIRFDGTANTGGPFWITNTDTTIELDAENTVFV